MKFAIALFALLTISNAAFAGSKVQVTSTARPLIMKWNFASK